MDIEQEEERKGRMVQVIKKDGTLEDFNVQKVVDAVNKSANRVLITFTEEEERFICQFVEERVAELGIERQHGQCSGIHQAESDFQ